MEPKPSALADLADRLDDADHADPKQFRELVNAAAEVMEAGDRRIAELVEMSRPTVNRWRSGKAVPCPSMRRAVCRILAKDARARGRRERLK